MSPWSIIVSAACGVVMLRIILSIKSIMYLLGRWWRWVDERAQVYQYFEIPRYTKGSSREEEEENPLYRKAAAYVASLPSLEDADAAAVFSSARKPNDFALNLAPLQSAHDSYLGARISWSENRAGAGAGAGAGAALVLRVRRQDRTRVLRPYLQHVEAVADELELRRRGLRLFSSSPGGRGWSSAAFTHPATLDAVAMEAELKGRVRADLEGFLKGRAYYHRLGRVWRRSYLLYGAPGTGKSSFAAAMARFLGFDVYDLDLAHAPDPRGLLLRTTPRSLILIEDLDRHLGEAARLTGILGFMDGIFSCCGDERVMVFTMSGSGGGGKETLDPAILRPGRLDVHIHFPLCDFAAFKTLASSYLGLRDHKLYPQVEESFQSGARLSPAEVGEIMIANRGSPSRAIKSVISALQHQQQQQQQHQHQQANCGPRSSTMARRLNKSWSGRKFDEIASGDGGSSGNGNCGGPSGLGFARDNTLKEFKKLYGFIKIRSGSRKEGTMAVEAAAAAAAAAATATATAATTADAAAANGNNNMNGVDHKER